MLQAIKNKKLLVLLDQAIVSGGNFVLGVLLARLLGLAAFGEYALLWMGVLFVLGLHQAFVTQPLMSLYASKKGKEEKDYWQGLSQLQSLLGLAVIVLSVTAFYVAKALGVSGAWASYVPICGFLTAFFLWQDFLRKCFFVKQHYLQPLLIDVVLYVPLLMALPILYQLGQLDLKASLWAMAILYAMSSGLGFWLFVKRMPVVGCRLPVKLATDNRQLASVLKEHYHYSYWLLGTSLVQWFSGNFFLLAAASVLGAVAVGALRMAQNMVGLCHVLFLALENIVPARAAQHFFEHGKTAMYAYLKQITLLGGVPVLAMLGGITVAAPWLIKLLYGAEYQSYSYLVGIYSLLYLFVYIGFPLRFALRTLQHTSPIFIAYCISAGISVLVAYPMVQTWGIAGVMAGLIGTQILTLLVYVFFLYRNSDCQSEKHLNHLKTARTGSPSYTA